MRASSWNLFLIPIAIGTGGIVLAGYFTQHPFIVDLRTSFLRWAIILSAVALIIGVINLLRVHIKKARSSSDDRIFSLLLTASFLITIFAVGIFGLTSSVSKWIFLTFLLPVDSSLLSVLAIILILIMSRVLFGGLKPVNLIFVSSALFILLTTPLLSIIQAPALLAWRNWIEKIWSLGGTRAILVGVALGAVTAGVRVLIGADRPYEG